MRTKLSLPLARSAAKFFPDSEDGSAENDDGTRKLTPQTAQQTDDKGKKGAAAAANGKDAKGAKGGAPPAKPPASKPTGKKGADAQEPDDAPNKPQLARINFRPKQKVESARNWTRERQLLEIQYKREFTNEVRALVGHYVKRICGFFEDVKRSERDVPTPMHDVKVRLAAEAKKGGAEMEPEVIVQGSVEDLF
ncbi:hypothetical protein HDV05_002444 [Chytridiales sp. JEL 0842]|nr:hypothetical protein HDV05_002444 [Chytridiales sp. JEL 0842]